MGVISNPEQVKEISDLKDQIKKTDQKFSNYKNDIDEIFKTQVNSINKKIKEVNDNFNQELNEKFNILSIKLDEYNKKVAEEFNLKLNNRINHVDDRIKILVDNIQAINDSYSLKFQLIREEFDTKEEVLNDMLNSIKIEFIEFKNDLKPQLEVLKSDQDLVKITVDVLKNQIHESTKEWISDEIRIACKNKEREILMNIWIDELKEIINDLDKLKKKHPKELKLYLNEIFKTSQSFKQKFI